MSNRIPHSFIVQKRKQFLWGWKPYSTQMLISIDVGTRTQISISRPQPFRRHVCWDVWLEKHICFLRELFYLWDNQIGGTIRFFSNEILLLNSQSKIVHLCKCFHHSLFIHFLWVFMNLLPYLFNIALFFYRLCKQQAYFTVDRSWDSHQLCQLSCYGDKWFKKVSFIWKYI